MAGGPIFPSSIYLGGASGNLSPTFYVPNTNTVTNQGTMEGIGVVGSLGADATAVLQFNMPEVIPAGTDKLRVLGWAISNSGVSKYTVQDGHVAPSGASLGTVSLTTESQVTTPTWTTDLTYENKMTLGMSNPSANDIVTILVTFNTSGWTLTAASVWQFSIVWE